MYANANTIFLDDDTEHCRSDVPRRFTLWYGRKVWHSNTRYASEVWQCNHKYDGDQPCTSARLRTERIKSAYLKAFNQLPQQLRSDHTLLTELSTQPLDTSAAERELEETITELASVTKRMEGLISVNERTTDHRDGLLNLYNTLADQRDQLESKTKKLTAQIKDTIRRRRAILASYHQLDTAGEVAEFDPRLWVSLLDHAIVDSTQITFVFKDGHEIPVAFYPLDNQTKIKPGQAFPWSGFLVRHR